jgi:hypothetical protein
LPLLTLAPKGKTRKKPDLTCFGENNHVGKLIEKWCVRIKKRGDGVLIASSFYA